MKTNSRRQFLGGVLAGTAGFSFPGFLKRAQGENEMPPGGGTAKRVIYLLMRGGMSQFETYNPRPEAHQPGGPNQIPTTIPGYQMSEWLPELAKRMDRCAVIQSMTNPSGGHADSAEYFLKTGYHRRSTLRHPCLGSWTSWHFAKAKKAQPIFLIGGDSEIAEEWLGPDHAPMVIRDPSRGSAETAFRISGDELDLREKIWEQLNRPHGSQAIATGEYKVGLQLMRDGIEDIVDVKKAPPEDQIRFGPHSFGQGCLIAARLAHADASCFTEVILDGWDAPAPYFPEVRARCAMLDQGLSALLYDLEKRDLLRETLVVLATPVGRRPDLHAGTRFDHSHAFSCLLAGGGIKGGQIHGETNPSGIRATKDAVTPQGLNRTIAWALGIDYHENAYSPSGRPFTMGGGTSEDLPLVNLFQDQAAK